MFDIISFLLVLVPLYITNGSALVFGGGKPIDFGLTINGKRLLGDGKTIKGTIAALVFGFFSVLIINYLFSAFLPSNYVIAGSLLCVGAVLGDFIGSFIKRRLNLKRGTDVPLMDQLGFVVCGIILAYYYLFPGWLETAALLIVTLFIHRLTNWIAFKIKMKSVPW